MTTTKNTTPAERRIARRAELAAYLNEYCNILARKGFETKVLRSIVTELHIGNTEIVLSQPWETDIKPGQAVELKPNEVILEAPVGIFSKVVLSAGGTGGGGSPGSNPPPTHDKPAPPPNPPRPTVTVGALNIPGRREPGITLQAGADGRLAPTATGTVVAVHTSGKPLAELRVDNGKLTMLTRREAANLPEGTTYLFPSAEVEAAHNSGFAAGKQYALSTLLITDEMVERAVDGWHQWWNDYKGAQTTVLYACAMRHALQQALGVRHG